MGQKRKLSGEDVLRRVRGQRNQNEVEEALQDQHQQSNNNQFDDQFQNEDITSSSSHDDSFDTCLNPNEVQPQQKEEGHLLVIVKDTCTGETITRKMVASQVWHLEKSKKVLVEINGNGQGNDSGSNLLVRFLGQVAERSAFCPLSVTKWDLMSKDNSMQQWKCIEDHFEFDYAAGIKWVRTTLGERWKAHKYKIRNRYFYPNKSKAEILANPPPGVSKVEWAAFVHYYQTDEMKKLSQQNTTNRGKLKVSHAGGSKSNARRAREMELKLGRPVCRSEVKLATLLKKDGSYLNGEGKAMAEKISESLTEDQERAATTGVPSKINAYPNDAIGKACGAEHPGRTRVLGPSVCPSVAFGNRRDFADFIQVGNYNQVKVEELAKTQEELAKTQEELAKTKEEHTQTKEKLTQATNTLESVHNFLQHKFGGELSMFNLGLSSS